MEPALLANTVVGLNARHLGNRMKATERGLGEDNTHRLGYCHVAMDQDLVKKGVELPAQIAVGR